MNLIGMKIDEVRIDGCLAKFHEDLKAIREMGVRAVELPVHGLDAIINGRLRQTRLKEVLDLLSDFDFAYSVHSPNPLNLMDRTEPELHCDVLLASLEFARQVGAKAVVVHPGRFIPEEEFGLFPLRSLTQKEKELMIEKEAVLLSSIADQYPDICIALENARPYLSQSPYTYAESISDLKAQVLRVNRKNVRINLDFGHLSMTSNFYNLDPVAEAAKISGLIVHTHVHDNFGGVVHHFQKQQTHQLPLGKGDSHMPVGWGAIPIQKILEIILPGYEGLLMMELRSRYFSHIKESMDNLSAMVHRSRFSAMDTALSVN